jgi:hypothetical protein
MTHAAREELREELLAKVPRWYSPAAHLALPALAVAAVAGFAVSRIRDLHLWELALVPAFLVIGNAIEWHAHRGLLHRRVRFLEALYVHHTSQHHALHVADSMAIRGVRELRFVLLPGYAMLAVLAATAPAVLLFFAVGQPNLAALWVASAAVCLLSYEWLHLACHLPESSWIGRRRLIERLRRHHQIHHVPHLMLRWNLNVSVPLWDLLRGTVYASPRAAPAGARPVPVRRDG